MPIRLKNPTRKRKRNKLTRFHSVILASLIPFTLGTPQPPSYAQPLKDVYHAVGLPTDDITPAEFDTDDFTQFHPVKGTVKSEQIVNSHYEAVIQSRDTNLRSPIRGHVYYVGNIKGYGLTTILKNDHYVVVIGRLHHTSLKAKQKIRVGSKLGSVAYKQNVFLGVYALKPYPGDTPKKPPTKLTYQELSRVLTRVGFPKKSLKTMYCIAKWESNLNPKAINMNTNRTIDVGLFQINSAWFERCGASAHSLYDVNENARCALTVLKESGFSAWVTFNKFGSAHTLSCEYN